jgi:hypothetical protein
MSKNVKVPYGKGGDNATLLLAAAEELEMEPSVVRTTMHGFEVPEEVASKAGLDTVDPDEAFNKEIDEARKQAAKQEKVEAPGNDMTLSRSGFDEQAGKNDPAPEPQTVPAKRAEAPAKKAPAKKAAAKKAPAKKATAKKTAAKKSTTNKES